MWVLSCLASLPSLFVSCLLHHFIYPRFSPLHKFQYLLTFGASNMFAVLVTTSFFPLFSFFTHRYWAIGSSSFFPHFSPCFQACITTLLSSRALGTRSFFRYFSSCFLACLSTVLSFPVLGSRRAPDSYYFCYCLLASFSHVTCFIFHQTPRKFQYFVIQDSSIMLGLLEESLKHKGKLSFCSACMTQSYSLRDTWLF